MKAQGGTPGETERRERGNHSGRVHLDKTILLVVSQRGSTALAVVKSKLSVTDGVEGVCVDPGEKKPSWKPRNPARQERE